ncbi:MAG: hypothetical protein A2542_03055 [Parcubacteria group bacterium RIFOXYD2_FULL_52_8]|nr:MAG: hypothetical protein A2542_03055 [Parcubacteria group bacterium RIFOXYD2_FULL_52_8]
MYRIYTTDAFVLGSEPAAEASLKITLFTRELGLVRAHAQGVRLLSSKLKSGLQILALSRVSLVRGREVWRLTSAVAGPLALGSREGEKRLLWARLLALVARLIHGEEADEQLYTMLEHFYEFVLSEELDREQLHCAEVLATLRILDHLGYVGDRHESLQLLMVEPLALATLANVGKEVLQMQTVINNSLQASQL